MAAARGNYSPRRGSSGEAARSVVAEARAERFAALDRAYRLALGIKDGEPTPRNLGVVIRGQGRPRTQIMDSTGGRHSISRASR